MAIRVIDGTTTEGRKEQARDQRIDSILEALERTGGTSDRDVKAMLEGRPEVKARAQLYLPEKDEDEGVDDLDDVIRRREDEDEGEDSQ